MDIFLPLLMGAAILLVIFAVWNLVNVSSGSDAATASFKRQCVAAGGHTYGTGLTLCLTTDGRVIEVFP